MKNILIVDDSALMRKVLCDIINEDELFHVKDICKDGLEAYDMIKNNAYDLVLLDINMPRFNGLDLLERLRREDIQARIVIISALTTANAETTIQALERGAIDFIAKPENIIESKGDNFKENFWKVIKGAMHAPMKNPVRPAMSAKNTTGNGGVKKKAIVTGEKIVAIACSTGGPKALQQVVPYLAENLNAPVVIVQHMPEGFTSSLAERLDELSKVKVKEAEDGEELKKGVVYISRGGKHLLVKRITGNTHVIEYGDQPAVSGLKPYANYMYESLRNSGYGEITCVVLTGMGNDGTNGIVSLQKSKPIHTIAQDEKTSVVYGMPKAVMLANVVDEVVPLKEIAQAINKNVGVQ